MVGLKADNQVKEWDSFWKERHDAILGEQVGGWPEIAWPVSLRYWEEVFRLAPGRRMLECGAGSARVSLHLAGLGFDCTMLDYSTAALALARDRFGRATQSGRFVRGDMNTLPFRDRTFDAVFSGGVLHHFYDVGPPIHEMVRVLRPGGLLAATIVPRRFSCQTLGDIQIALARLVKRMLKGRRGGLSQETYGGDPFYVNSISLREYRRLIENQGVSVLVATGISPFPVLSLPSALWSAYLKLIARMVPWWERFDRSTTPLTALWGSGLAIYGLKR